MSYNERIRKVVAAALLVSAVILLSFQENRYVECFQFPDNKTPNHRKNRRHIIASFTQFASVILLDPRDHQRNANALSLPSFDQQQDRRQKELCLVNILRLQFWASSLSDKILAVDMSDEERRKSLYLEARLGSKVMVAESKKISGGANANVFMLKGLHLRDCLDDLSYYSDKKCKRQMNQYKDDLIESIASIVEFDGLETTQDPSPRSSLTLTMYNAQKVVYVQRMLSERIVPLTDDILRLFGPDARAQTEYYMREFYPAEMGAKKSPDTEIPVTETL
mmetsp:Transcript_24099/g.51195  ORF Transcript_24099/g.51195 Transcript_24099/m.51195 type:complete len:279 (+) Transcript_24099:69-905(+)